MTSHDPREEILSEDEARAANPSSESRHGLAGDLGISSERTNEDLEDVEGTGSLASVREKTDGASKMSPDSLEPVDEVHRQEQAVEENPDDVPGHVSDPSRNPGHSHG